jgi:uncharacterized tellurite resistance protein B-like protein
VLDAIKRFFDRHLSAPAAADGAQGETENHRLVVAACALLLEVAQADQEFSDAERAHVEETLTRHFDLPLDTAREIMRLAEEERRRAVDLYQFTSLINRHYDEGQRLLLAEVLWRIVYADGEIAKHESYLMRKLSTLLDLRPGYLAEAKRRAEQAG